MSNRSPFEPPSWMWGLILYPAVAVLLILNFEIPIRIIQGGLTNRERLMFSIQFSSLIAVLYLLFGYHYLRWATKKKTDLYHIAQNNRNVLYQKFGRYFINAEECKKQGVSSLSFKRLRQTDLREVEQRLKFVSVD